jgi:hypothetical protein
MHRKPAPRSARTSSKNGRETMIRTTYWGTLASFFLAIAFLTGCSSNPATVTPAAVTTVLANTPYAQNTTLNTAFASPFSVTVTSGTLGTPGTAVSGITVTFSAPGAGAGGNFSGATSATGTTDANGVATSSAFTANGTVGTYLVIASVGTSQSTAIFTVSNTLVPQATAVAGGSPQSTTTGTQFATPLSVTVLDATSAPVTGLPVTFTAPDGFFTDTDDVTTTATTNSSGVATAAPYVASATVGTYTVTATPSGSSAVATFSLSNTIKPVTITTNAGTTPQSATAGTAFGAALAVTVMDGSTPPKPVPNAVVMFAAPGYTVDSSGVPSAASGAFTDSTTPTTTAWTDANGVATAAGFVANTLAGGPYNVSATVVVQSGTTLSVNFSLTNQ